jgi:hypothetical protein
MCAAKAGMEAFVRVAAAAFCVPLAFCAPITAIVAVGGIENAIGTQNPR